MVGRRHLAFVYNNEYERHSLVSLDQKGHNNNHSENYPSLEGNYAKDWFTSWNFTSTVCVGKEPLWRWIRSARMEQHHYHNNDDDDDDDDRTKKDLDEKEKRTRSTTTSDRKREEQVVTDELSKDVRGGGGVPNCPRGVKSLICMDRNLFWVGLKTSSSSTPTSGRWFFYTGTNVLARRLHVIPCGGYKKLMCMHVSMHFLECARFLVPSSS
ncbi:hypothetical protein ACA910_003215 [Epithemia clementina (nom. ined.)]